MVLWCLMACVLSGAALQAGTVTRPNILFILADDLGAHDAGCYGSVFHSTPQIDALAGRGVRLTQAYAANPSCSPTRASILTGLDPARIGITSPSCHFPELVLGKTLLRAGDDKVYSARGVTRLNTAYQSLAVSLGKAGYRTAHFGKWHLGAKPYSPLEHGFETDWPGTSAPGPGGVNSYFAPWAFAPNVPQVPGEHIEERMAAEAVEWMRQHKDEPFFLNYWAFSVHGPWKARADYVDWFKRAADPLNPQRNPVNAAMTLSLDDAVGTLIRGLDELGIADRTIIVLTSDNGGTDFLDRQTMNRFGFSSPPTSNRPLRGGKGTIYEGGTRVPAIIVWPGVIAPGAVSNAIFQSTDFHPTLLRMAGVPLPDAFIDGIDQTPVLRGGPPRRDTVFCHWPHGGGNEFNPGWAPSTSIRRGNFKLIRFYADGPEYQDRYELYNLQTDPGETKNLFEQSPAKARELKQLMDRHLADRGAVIPRLNPNWREFVKWQAAEGSSLKTGAGIGTVFSISKRPTLHLRTPPERSGGKLRLRVRLRVVGQAESAILSWTTAGSPGVSSDNKLEIPLAAPQPGTPSNWQTITFDFATTSAIERLWLVANTGAETVRIDWIRLSKPDGRVIQSWDF